MAGRGVEEEVFGVTPSGETVMKFTLTSTSGKLRMALMSFGATLMRVDMFDADSGALEPVTLWYDTLAEYLADKCYLGATCGRVANRVGGARFSLDGTAHRVTANLGEHSLHGGAVGWSRRVWAGHSFSTPERAGVRFSLASADGEEGYPGAVRAHATYTLIHATNQIEMVFEAEADAPTVVNMCNHAYWNLSRWGPPPSPSPSLGDMVLSVAADAALPTDATGLPLGAPVAVAGTAYDLRAPRLLAEVAAAMPPTGAPQGCDNAWCVSAVPTGPLLGVAVLHSPATGRGMRVSTTCPALQVYTSNYMPTPAEPPLAGGGGARYSQYAAVCLETSGWPNAPTQPSYPSVVVRPGQPYRQVTVHEFYSSR